jgi:hypothetical protein
MTESETAGRWLCRLLSAQPEAEAVSLPEPLPWASIVRLAQKNATTPLLYEAALSQALPVPQEQMEVLRQAYYATAAMNARLLGELERVLEHLSVSGVPAIVLKGAALAETVYDSAALRPMADLDILVPRDGVIETARLLEPLGYRARPGPPGHSFEYETRYSGEISLDRTAPAGGVMLDVHWHLLPHQWLHHATRLDVEALWRSAEPLTLGTVSALQLGPEDSLIHLCLHAGYGQGYAYLLNLLDIDCLVRAHSDLDWARFIEWVRACQVRTPVCSGLGFARDLLGTPVPDLVLNELRPGRLRYRTVERLADPGRTALVGQTSLPPSRQYLLHLALIDGPAGWCRLAAFVLWPGDEWLAARYGLSRPTDIHRARLRHPLRVLSAFLATLFPPLLNASPRR